MNRFKRSLQFAALSLATASTGWAQTQVTVVLTAPYAPPNMAAVTAFGYYMSPYSGTVNNVVERLNCVDFFHDVNIGDVWQANKVNLGQASTNLTELTTTRDGAPPNFAYFGSSLSNTLKVYEEMAWLSDQQPGNPGGTGADYMKTIAIQTAIWAIGDPNYETLASGDKVLTFDPLNTNPMSTGYWIGQAMSNYASQLPSYYYQFDVITNVSLTAGPNASQEFIYKTPTPEGFNIVVSSPEPGTLVLMGSGLIGMVGVASRRRKRVAHDSVADDQETM